MAKQAPIWGINGVARKWHCYRKRVSGRSENAELNAHTIFSFTSSHPPALTPSTSFFALPFAFRFDNDGCIRRTTSNKKTRFRCLRICMCTECVCVCALPESVFYYYYRVRCGYGQSTFGGSASFAIFDIAWIVPMYVKCDLWVHFWCLPKCAQHIGLTDGVAGGTRWCWWWVVALMRAATTNAHILNFTGSMTP